MTPDLDAPVWQLLVLAGLLWLVLGLCELRSRRRRALARKLAAGRDDRRLDDEPQHDDAEDSAEGEPENSETLSGRVVNVHGGILSTPRRHPLTDAELLAVARHFDRVRLHLPEAPDVDLDLYSARDKIASDALDVLHSDRIHRRG